MIKHVILLAGICLGVTSSTCAATFIQYEAHFSGHVTGFDRGTNTVYDYLANETVYFNLPTAVDGSTTGYDSFISSSSFPGGYIDIRYANPASSIYKIGFASGVTETFNISLGAATNGALTDYESANGSYSLVDTLPSPIYATMELTSFTTHFSSTAFGGPIVDSFLTHSVPEPATWAMFITGFGLTGLVVRRKKKAASFA